MTPLLIGKNALAYRAILADALQHLPRSGQRGALPITPLAVFDIALLGPLQGIPPMPQPPN